MGSNLWKDKKKSLLLNEKNSAKLAEDIENTSLNGQILAFRADEREDTQIQLLPLETVTPGKFRPHPHLPHTFWAHPQTILAIRADLFVTDEKLDEYSLVGECTRCRERADLQFWKVCPQCGGKLDA